MKEERKGRTEQVRRLGEPADLFLNESTNLIIATAVPAQENPFFINLSINETVERIKEMLKDRRIIFRPF